MITTEILPQAFEIIRDRIALVLKSELDNQANLFGDETLNVPMYIERVIPFDKSELVSINVSLSSGDEQDHSILTQDFDYVYFVDVVSNSKSKVNPSGTITAGDNLGSLLMQKIYGKCRSILMNSLYLTLGFPRGFIQSQSVKGFEIGQPNNPDDSMFTNVLRFRVGVRATETNSDQSPHVIGDYESKFTVNDSEFGYKLLIENV